METSEEMGKEKAMWTYVPLKLLNDVYLKTMALTVPMENSSCEDLAEFLMKTLTKLTLVFQGVPSWNTLTITLYISYSTNHWVVQYIQEIIDEYNVSLH